MQDGKYNSGNLKFPSNDIDTCDNELSYSISDIIFKSLAFSMGNEL